MDNAFDVLLTKVAESAGITASAPKTASAPVKTEQPKASAKKQTFAKKEQIKTANKNYLVIKQTSTDENIHPTL